MSMAYGYDMVMIMMVMRSKMVTMMTIMNMCWGLA